MAKQGWFLESWRHKMARLGIKTAPDTRGKRKMYRDPKTGKFKPSIFFEAKYKTLAEDISIRSPAEARISVKRLENRKTRPAIRRVLRAAILAANRARAAAGRKGLSGEERDEMMHVADIYDDFAAKMSRKLKEFDRIEFA